MVHTKESLSTGELVRQMSEQMSRLVRDELRLARIELMEKGKHAGIGAGLMGAAGVVALLGAGAVVASAIIALTMVLTPWASALVVGIALLFIAGLLALVGKSQVSEAGPPMPSRTLHSVKTDIDVVREGARR